MTPVAYAGSSTDVALGLAAFADFKSLFRWFNPVPAHAFWVTSYVYEEDSLTAGLLRRW